MELRLDEVFKMTGLSQGTIYRKGRNGSFPKRFYIDKTHVRWHLNEVLQWMKDNNIRLHL